MNGQTDNIWSSPIHRKNFLRRDENVQPKVSTNLKKVFFKREEIASYFKTQLRTEETTPVLSRHIWLNNSIQHAANFSFYNRQLRFWARQMESDNLSSSYSFVVYFYNSSTSAHIRRILQCLVTGEWEPTNEKQKKKKWQSHHKVKWSAVSQQIHHNVYNENC